VSFYRTPPLPHVCCYIMLVLSLDRGEKQGRKIFFVSGVVFSFVCFVHHVRREKGRCIETRRRFLRGFDRIMMINNILFDLCLLERERE